MEHERRYDLEKKFRDELGSKYDADGKFKEGFEFALKLFIAMEDEREKHSEEIVSMLMEESNKVHTCLPNERAFLDEIREKMENLITEICNLANSYCYDDGTFNYSLFEESLRKIMPPTCSKNERAFLDEIKDLYEWNDHLGFPHLQRKEITKYSNIYQQDFTKCNLSELVEGKG